MIIDTTKTKVERNLHICPYIKGGGLCKECGKFWRRIGDSEMYTCNFDNFNEVLDDDYWADRLAEGNVFDAGIRDMLNLADS